MTQDSNDFEPVVYNNSLLEKITTKEQKTLREVLRHLILRPDGFTAHDAREGLASIMEGEATEAQQGAFLTALKIRGVDRYPEMITGLVQEMLTKTIKPDVKVQGGSITFSDIVGTGGDGWSTFNVSTTASIVAAGAGLIIGKHGSRASSSNCGSADILEKYGCNLEAITPDSLDQIYSNCNFCFLFAKTFHPSMKYLAKARYEIGFPTPFNILGPLTNPLPTSSAIIGVHSTYLGRVIAEVLVCLGKTNHWVVCGKCQIDEISIDGPTDVWKVNEKGQIEHVVMTPEDYGLKSYPLDLAFSQSLEQNIETLNRLLDGKQETEKDRAIRSFVLINAASLIYVSKKASSLKEAVKIAEESIDSGNARAQLDAFAKATNELKHNVTA
ncbi:hypothetical protein BB560_001565 [Smittium megazygosporum]|uniref:Anthranilate phosphoribosyltransferase n=1 Tax=Smittium megazygosporum TaxID=133381 RepID=A0A2T9ZH71_9FUNG|nr:hypothetical protein BB560_001565 [Smittium megazygosporum]